MSFFYRKKIFLLSIFLLVFITTTGIIFVFDKEIDVFLGPNTNSSNENFLASIDSEKLENELDDPKKMSYTNNSFINDSLIDMNTQQSSINNISQEINFTKNDLNEENKTLSDSIESFDEKLSILSQNQRSNFLNQSEPNTLTYEETEYIKYNNGKKPPEKYKEWIIFAKEKHCPLSLDFYSQIFEDISPFFTIENGITVSKITKEMQEKPHSFSYSRRITLKNHKKPGIWGLNYGIEAYFDKIIDLLPENIDLSYNYHDEDVVLPADDSNTAKPYNNVRDSLERNECLRTKYNNNSVDIIPETIAYNHGSFISPGSFITSSLLFPVLSMGKRDCFKDLIYPVPTSLELSNDQINWKDKEAKVVWRGRNTGTWIRQGTPYKLTHRYRLVDWAINQADYIWKNLGIKVDVGFSDMHQCDNWVLCNEAKRNSYVAPYLSYSDQFKAKYLIVVDGNSWAHRIGTFLSSNSLVLYNGIYTFWFSKHLKPYVHYLPFKEDFSDLTEQLEYAKNHDEEMKQIAANARKFVEEFLNKNSLTCYLALLTMEYAELVKHLYN